MFHIRDSSKIGKVYFHYHISLARNSTTVWFNDILDSVKPARRYAHWLPLLSRKIWEVIVVKSSNKKIAS
jgi:hypothetical protein